VICGKTEKRALSVCKAAAGNFLFSLHKKSLNPKKGLNPKKSLNPKPFSTIIVTFFKLDNRKDSSSLSPQKTSTNDTLTHYFRIHLSRSRVSSESASTTLSLSRSLLSLLFLFRYRELLSEFVTLFHTFTENVEEF